MKKILFLVVVFLGLNELYAQFPPRVEDHFWRKKVFERIDLEEKLNAPLTASESKIYTKGKYGETDGIVRALINGYKDGKFIGYKYGSLQTPVTYKDFENIMKGQATSSTTSGGGGDEEEEEFEDEGGDEMDEGGAEQATTDGQGQQGDNMAGGKGNNAQNSDMLRYEKFLGIIEDRIFDKNKSDMYYDIQYICLIDYDEQLGRYETQVCFSYKDVMDILDDTQYKNRNNDAEYRSMKEIIELRLFKSVLTELSGEELDLKLAEKRNNQMIEFEHYLWEF
ncbi:MAG: hypothetical protein KatS3mg035_0209 [Bacteroidia bacterium]|nr:MAG: hypothetical protein KatS3mg035_0209 [Bacteroidia bacterium]